MIDRYDEECRRQQQEFNKAEKKIKESEEKTEGDKKEMEEIKRIEKTINKLLKRIDALHSLHRKRNVLTIAAAGNDSLGMKSDKWDLNPRVLGCLNGIVDLRTGEFRPGRPDDYIKTVAPTEWQGIDIPAPDWENFLNEIFDGSEALVSFMQRLLGYSITGLTTEHILPVLWGEGRNGKGTLLEVLEKVLGPLAGPIQSGMLLNQAGQRSSAGPTPDIMSLRGRRLVWASETNEGKQFDVARIKWLVGGDTLVGRPPYGRRDIKFDPTHTLFLLTNHKPYAQADDYAFWQRVLLIPFEVRFEDVPNEAAKIRQRDPELKEKLLAESSGILAWLVRGCLMWQEEGLNPPQEVKNATKEYQKEDDILGHFIEDCCETDPDKINSDNIVRAGDLYIAYTKWCTFNGHKPMSNTMFGKKMSKRFIKGKDDKGKYYQGLKLVFVPEPNEDKNKSDVESYGYGY